MSIAKGIWVLAEYEDGELRDFALELLSEARRLADKLGDQLCTIVAGHNLPVTIDKFGEHGADKVYVFDNPLLEDSVEHCTQAVSSLISEQAPRLLLCGHTPVGRDIAARLAAASRTGLVAECISLSLGDDGLLLQSKPVYAGKALATVVCPASSPQIATVAPGIFDMKRARPPRKPEVIPIAPELDTSMPCPKILDITEAELESLSLDEATTIVAGGRGVGSVEHFEMLDSLAKLLRGVTAGTRMAVDAGYIPTSKQIGQTGRRVSPRFYLACGISGSSYHTIGMKDSKVIAAINKDPNALIFKLADIAMVGDIREIVPAIIEELTAIYNQETAETKEA